MISVIKTTRGTYNIIGTNNEGFCLQGHLNLDELRELLKEVDNALMNENDE